ncbi:glycosyltransferase [Prosthecochloris marina]|nr:glycosyltransferase [Prosthecochloris marina]
MPHIAIRHIDSLYSSIVFSGFHYLQEHSGDGWVYWLPRYILRNTSLQVYFLSNEQKLFFLKRNETLCEVEEQTVKKIDIFFARTLNSFPVDHRLLFSAKLKILYPISDIIPETILRHHPIIIHDSRFIKPLPEHERAFFYYKPSKKENLLLYPSAIHRRKGQIEFAQSIKAGALRGKKVLFCGTIKSEQYAEKCFSLLRKKKVDFEYLGKIPKKTLGELYRKSLLTLILSRGDWNPRTFYESMACGTPCLLSRKVQLASEMEEHAIKTSKLLLNYNILKCSSYTEELSIKLQKTSLEMTEEYCYNILFSYIFTEIRQQHFIKTKKQ